VDYLRFWLFPLAVAAAAGAILYAGRRLLDRGEEQRTGQRG
jgi:hypothetical protein